MDKVKQVLSEDDTVLFVGSGISLWSGLPSWSQLIDELATFVTTCGGNDALIRTQAARGDLLQAASYGVHQLTKTQVGEFIRNACRYGSAKPHAIHRKLATLGPRCFVTTNYDNLLDEALRSVHPAQFFKPPITNRHLTELAEIVHARATCFLFKPHGDAGDSESIILTREHYRDLLPGGERHAALDTLKTLMVSRPIVYVGFGLTDPDFLFLRDILANTYRGGTRDHYAVMADVGPLETAYWRSEYGIHLMPYATKTKSDGSRDHSELLTLLDKLRTPSVPPPGGACPSGAPSTHARVCDDPALLLALARHAARLSGPQPAAVEFRDMTASCGSA